MNRARPKAEPSAWEVMPGPREAARVARRCRRLVTQRALMAAGVSMVPIPGLDWVTDVGVLVRLLPEINREFGLTPDQVARLAPDRQVMVYKAASAAGSLLIGRVITKTTVMGLLKVLGVRLTAQQAAKFVPLAGQAVSAALTFSALRWVCNEHIRQCVAICEQLELPPPQPVQTPDEPAAATIRGSVGV